MNARHRRTTPRDRKSDTSRVAKAGRIRALRGEFNGVVRKVEVSEAVRILRLPQEDF